MSRATVKTFTDEEIIENLTHEGKNIDDYYLEETLSGNLSISACFNGQDFDFFWEDEQLRLAVLAFLKKRGARIVPYKD
ncbi:hypothetical protein [Budvicia aquatica]|uniref:Uncharacterized protein n=1 Tax=Budvicia aquatica TaxID=82979 RepID=A0A2C6DK93_9GAMM|nr:hypothetical protein [Budvicia aquatica]PHI28855.1 hypothetical protein CRN84_05785 [Budvicia aquatica]VFS46966.1 Uncharacterised protein [Budvicia aquatica]